MSNRNYDASTMIKIFNAQNAANFNNRQQQIVNTIRTVPAKVQIQPANPQTANTQADVIPIIQAGQQAYYFKGLPITTVLSPQNYIPGFRDASGNR